MTSETITEGEKVTVYTYAYDNVSNRILKTENGAATEYVYNALNQLVSDSETTYEYDLNGNLIRVISTANSALYEYNSENKLVKVTVQNGVLVTEESYAYDYQGNRTSKSTHKSNGEYEYTKYLNDNSSLTNVLAEIDENGTAKCVYTIGADLISQERNGRTSFYLYDGHGSVVGLTDESGRVTDTYVYDAFGNLLKSTGSTENCYRYCGEQFDETTGLYYLRARYMDTSTGRFISQDSYVGSISDPISLHKYLYANANPVMLSDPSGYIGLLDTVCASAIGNVLFYSASAGLITFGMGLIRQLREIDNGIRKTIDWSNLIKETIFSTALAAGLSCLSLLILPLITNLLAKAIICYVLAGTGLFFGGVGLKNCYNDISAKNYDLAVLDFFFAILSFYGAKKSFDSARIYQNSVSPKNPSSNSKYQKASLFERLFVKKANINDLYPCPKDDFSNPNVGPSNSAVAKYIKEISQTGTLSEPIEVQKLSSGGYEIVNGHHRWLAAQKVGLEEVPIKISNYDD